MPFPSPATIAAAAIAILCAAALALWLWHQHRRARARQAPAQPYTVDMADIPLPADEAQVVAVTLVPGRLTIGTDRVTLDYRLHVINTGTGHLLGLRLGLDLHASGTGDEADRQAMMGPDLGRAARHTIARIDPRSHADVAGQVSLDLAQARSLARAGEQHLLPLVRLRIVGAGTPVRRFAFAVGLPPGDQEAAPRPVSLHAGPKILAPLSARQIG